MKKDLKKIIFRIFILSIPFIIWVISLLIVDPFNYFNLNHYGYASDFIRQGLDSRFDSNADTIRNRPIVEAAVRARFVEDDYDEENLNFRKFSLVKPSDIDGTAYETFQSSNISLFATSSLPFKEGSFGSTSLDVPTNRTYSVVAVEVS